MTDQRACATGTVLSQSDWDEMTDAIDLAKDALGDGPQDVDRSFLINNIIHLRLALRTAHRLGRTVGVSV